ncbi:hypothetical protein SOW02_16650 [Pectobacterium actinidiae]|uniref:hypothetical protein n=1 Tax=Pectobacterium actinidiae TaxID=1507808 RepID=UPI002A7ECB43|nr:hypothetical protein [Pectobacterium actinidiae]MDY4316554.1 hypothetical protein [Pectobacterium actinidiae]
MLRSFVLSISLPVFMSCFLFSSNAIGAEGKVIPIDFLNQKTNIIDRDTSCFFKKKTLEDIIVNNKISTSDIDRCIAECSYLLGIPGDYGSTRFHSCLAQCKGMIPMCDF